MTQEEILNFLKENKQEMEERYGVVKIGLFGSFARNESTPESDIDIAVDIRKPDMFCLIGIKQSIEEKFGVRVDIVRLRENMSSLMKHRIQQDVIYV